AVLLMPFIIASCQKTFTISSAPSCRDSHALPVAAGRAPHALQMSCASRTMRPTVMSEPNRHLRYVDAYIIPLAAIAAKHFGAMVAVVRPNKDAALVLRSPRLRPRSAVPPR